MGTIISINISLPRSVIYDGDRRLRSGINKKPVSGKIVLDTMGFQDDGSADLVHHGGEDKAVCAYCADHFPFWEKELGRKISPGAFGENLSIAGIRESKIHIGDIFRIGEAEIQCTQPRQPCHKLNKIFALNEMALRVQQTGYSGYYFRVLKTGWVESGAKVRLIEKGPLQFSIAAANELMHHDKYNFEKIRKILSIESLSPSWRQTFQHRLAKQSPKNADQWVERA